MNPLEMPWLEITLVLPALGAAMLAVVRGPSARSRWGLAFAGATLCTATLAWLGFYRAPEAAAGSDAAFWLPSLNGEPIFVMDELSAPLVPLVALLHFLTALATARTKSRRFPFAWMLAAESVRLSTFACRIPWLLIGLLIAGCVPPFVELVRRGKPTRVYVLHMGLFAGLLVAGWSLVATGGADAAYATWAALPLLVAVLIRSGTFPFHTWITDLFEHASFGGALLAVTPITGVYAAMRLVLPVASDALLQGVGIVSLVTALYAAGMAIVQTDARRFFAYFFVSHAALILVGLELVSVISLTGALCMWFSVALSLTGVGLSLRAVEARVGPLHLSDYQGLYELSPALAICFLLSGLASVGFPGTLGFVSTELLVDGAVEANLYLGLAVALTAAFNSIAVLRVYFLLFTGKRRTSTIPLQITFREWAAVLTLAALIVGGGLLPQPGVRSRYNAAHDSFTARDAPQPPQPDASH